MFVAPSKKESASSLQFFSHSLGSADFNLATQQILIWPILSHVLSLLGFRTPRAKQVVKEGIDHHRSRQILEACLEAISKELLTLYVRDCMKNNTTPNAESYQIWLSNVKDHTYLFYYHVTFLFLLSFHLLTEAVRKNNADHIMAARV